jgi:hypothetical protein
MQKVEGSNPFSRLAVDRRLPGAGFVSAPIVERMQGRAWRILSVAAFALLVLPACGASASTASCEPRGFETLIASPLVRVYAEPGAYATRPVYGCVEATGRRRRLGPVVPSREHQVQIPIVRRPYVLSGYWFAAGEVEGYNIDQDRYVFFSKDVAGPGARRCVFGFSSNGYPAEPGTSRPFLAADGNFAWVEHERLHVCLATGPEVIGGTRVAARSLGLDGRRLTWKDSTGEHAFRL